MDDTKIPGFQTFMNPLLRALKLLGGSGTIEEINAKVVELMTLSDAQLAVPHNKGVGGRSEIEYRLAWARTYLKKGEILENSSRGVWALTLEGTKIERINERALVRAVREQNRRERATASEADIVENELERTWREELMDTLLRLKPDAFERLVQRILRESGFTQVEVTGRSGDEGIDGKGILRLSGLISFHVMFQCKRWQNSVGAGQMRDFRESLIGRADRGIFVTTSSFTPDAVREATRDGATPIDLVDGEQLMDKLKQLSLGVKTELVEKVTVSADWFANL